MTSAFSCKVHTRIISAEALKPEKAEVRGAFCEPVKTTKTDYYVLVTNSNTMLLACIVRFAREPAKLVCMGTVVMLTTVALFYGNYALIFLGFLIRHPGLAYYYY